MKKGFGLAVVAFTLLLGCRPVSICRGSYQESKPRPDTSLKLSTSVLEQTFCANGDVRMALRFRYTNEGREPIILPRYNFEFYRYTISRGEKEAAKHRYEMETHIFLSKFVQPFPTRGDEPSSDRFVILEPGQSYEEDGKPFGFYFFIRQSSGKRLHKGDHVLQLNVRTWVESIPLAEELSLIWRKYGVLWWQGVRSQPMPFKIEEQTSSIDCSFKGLD